MKRLPSLLLGLVLAVAAPWCAMSCTSKPSPPSTQPFPKQSASAPVAAPGPAAASKCSEELAKLRGNFESIPEDWRDAKDLAELKANVRTCIQMSEAFLRDCVDCEGGHEAAFFLARLLFSENRIAWTQWVDGQRKLGLTDPAIIQGRKKWVAGYFTPISQLAARAADKSPKGSPLRARSLDVQGDAHSEMGEHEKALEIYRRLLEELPGYEQKSSIYLAMITSFEAMGRQDEGIQVARKGMTEMGEDRHFPSFLDSLWRLNNSKGDLEGLLNAVEEMRSKLPARLQRPAITPRERESAERSLHYSGFRLGYAKFALGDFPGAVAAFRDHITDLNALEQKLAQAGKGFPQDLSVYRDMRSKDNLDALESKIGSRVSVDFGSAHWPQDRRPALVEGRVKAIVFRNYGETERSAPFVQGVDKAWRERKEDFELFTISFLKGSDDPAAQLAEVVAEANEFGFQCPVGLDPDAKDKSMFDAFHATVGSATFVIIDREGKYVWFQQDPRPKDVKFSLAIVDRVIKK